MRDEHTNRHKYTREFQLLLLLLYICYDEKKKKKWYVCVSTINDHHPSFGNNIIIGLWSNVV